MFLNFKREYRKIEWHESQLFFRKAVRIQKVKKNEQNWYRYIYFSWQNENLANTKQFLRGKSFNRNIIKIIKGDKFYIQTTLLRGES